MFHEGRCVERAVVLCEGDTLLMKHFQPGMALSPNVKRGSQVITVQSGPLTSIAEMEKMMILKALQEYEGNRTRAAEALGISIRTLRNKLRDYREAGIDIP